ncbi:relaxase/mobilization nuclease domain-containing protein [Chitinivorax sp. PXF-14]|uniref:relaxase/mobilization nuclease domain-containing protein n=1 Tax=Chitinivorax sp. PXF-14 TaxID=3230488 RepID=UPI0034666B19
MIVKIFNQGTSNGKAHIDYLFSEEKHKGFKPQLFKGNRFLTEEITGSITNKNKYTAGVIAFRDNETLEKSQLLDIIESFESTVAPFHDKGRVNFLWVLHKDKKNIELHFISPRIDLKSQKALDIHPNTKANLLLFEHFTRATNYKYGFEQVDKKDYKKGNFEFSKKLVRDLVEKRAIFFQSKYCEKKKNPYNKNTTRKIKVKNGMEGIGTTNKRSLRASESTQLDMFSNRRSPKDSTSTPQHIDRPTQPENRNKHTEREQGREHTSTTSQKLQSGQKHDSKSETSSSSKPDSRTSIQKANDLRNSPLISQLHEVQALYNSEHDQFKRLELYNRLLQLRYDIELEENAKKLEEEKKNQFKFK